MRRFSMFLVVLGVTMVLGVSSAFACGSLVAENGAVRLVRTTTLAAYHDGFEHYVTSFQFFSVKTSFGSVIPLPAKPSKVERGGDWTLQRLEREVNPPALREDAVAAAPTKSGVEVIQQLKIDALDVTVLRGGGRAVAKWAEAQGFTLNRGAPEMFEYYSQRSPYFLAAKYDADAAAKQGLIQGDATPIHITIPMDRPWVPLRILGTGKPASEILNADVFVLTDSQPDFLSGPGLTTTSSAEASKSLLDDLRSDKGMSWVPQKAWLTALALDAPAGAVNYDLAIGGGGAAPIRVADTGANRLGQFELTAHRADAGDDTSWLGAVGVGLLVVLLAGVMIAALRWKPIQT